MIVGIDLLRSHSDNGLSLPQKHMSRFLNFEIFDRPLDTIDLKSIRTINTINPHSFCIAKEDGDFAVALKKSDILLPDGVGIVWAVKLLNGEKIKKIAGFDVFVFLMNRLNQSHGSCFFLGSSDETLQLIVEKASVDYPNIKIGSFSPPYKASFSKEENEIMIDAVNSFKPDVLFIGMTAPKQEKWAFEHKDRLNAGILCSIGAVFDFYAGTVKRSSDFWIRLGLEWFPRFIREPRRLAKRNLISSPKFVMEILKYKTGYVKSVNN